MNWIIEEILPTNISIRCSELYWQKIIDFKHPSMKNRLEDVKNTIKHPKEIRSSHHLPHRLLVYKDFMDQYLCVVIKVKGDQGIILTCYLSDKIKEGEVIWTK